MFIYFIAWYIITYIDRIVSNSNMVMRKQMCASPHMPVEIVKLITIFMRSI